MAKMKALRSDDELSAVPLDQPVLVDLEPAGDTVEVDEPEDKPVKVKEEDTGVNVLKEQLDALKRANAAATERENAANRRAEQAERERAEAINNQSRTEADAVQSGLSGAQAELANAKLAAKQAGEAGDWEAQAEALSRVGRASSDIREFERAAATLADRKEERTEPQRQQVQAPDIISSIEGNPQLMASEKEWLKSHPEAYASRNKELDVAYDRAMRQGLSRGTPDYFKFMDEFMGYAKPKAEDDDMSVSAPVSRNERGGDGKPSNGKIMLTPEQREVAKSMGVSEVDYARQVQTLEQRRREDPDRYK
jgi:hypothetical protein